MTKFNKINRSILLAVVSLCVFAGCASSPKANPLMYNTQWDMALEEVEKATDNAGTPLTYEDLSLYTVSDGTLYGDSYTITFMLLDDQLNTILYSGEGITGLLENLTKNFGEYDDVSTNEGIEDGGIAYIWNDVNNCKIAFVDTEEKAIILLSEPEK